MKRIWEKLLKERGYVLRKTLGEGAYSKVKLAYSFDLKREVAIKCITFDDSPQDFLSKFLPRELKVLPKLHHKNIIQVYEIYQSYNETSPEKNYVCIVMEYAKHGDLLKYIQKRGALSESEVKRYFWQICQAVKYCHSRHLCHRDLKCENLLLGKNRTLLLTDFGFCKPVAVDGRGNVELSATFCGSAAYAAPETLQGKPYNPFMHDMWSLGVILYIMSCGEMPFDDSNVSKMLQIQLKNRVKFSSRLRSRLSDSLKSLIRFLLEVKVADRATMNDVFSHSFFQSSPDRRLLGDSVYVKHLEKVSNPHYRDHSHYKIVKTFKNPKETQLEELYNAGDTRSNYNGDFLYSLKAVDPKAKSLKMICLNCGHTE